MTTTTKAWPILLGAALLLSLAMGIRQSLGLFMLPMTQGIGATVADFTLSIAIQNALWGLTQPFVGALADCYGLRPIAVGGAFLYIAGRALNLCRRCASLDGGRPWNMAPVTDLFAVPTNPCTAGLNAIPMGPAAAA